MGYKVNIGLSNKHLHLSQKDLETLFGEGYQLTPKRIWYSRVSLQLKKL